MNYWKKITYNILTEIKEQKKITLHSAIIILRMTYLRKIYPKPKYFIIQKGFGGKTFRISDKYSDKEDIIYNFK